MRAIEGYGLWLGLATGETDPADAWAYAQREGTAGAWDAAIEDGCTLREAATGAVLQAYTALETQLLSRASGG